MGEVPPKTVTFNRVICVVLIPELKEYKAARLTSDLWYKPEEVNHFRNKYIEEITKQTTVSDRTDRP